MAHTPRLVWVNGGEAGSSADHSRCMLPSDLLAPSSSGQTDGSGRPNWRGSLPLPVSVGPHPKGGMALRSLRSQYASIASTEGDCGALLGHLQRGLNVPGFASRLSAMGWGLLPVSVSFCRRPFDGSGAPGPLSKVPGGIGYYDVRVGWGASQLSGARPRQWHACSGPSLRLNRPSRRLSERYSGFNLNNLVQWRFQVQERTLNLKQGLGMGQGLTHTQQQT